MKRSNKKGFTIVELVIVIAVIAILAAVLIPTIAGLVRKANISADKVVANQLNKAIATTTVEDFDDVLAALKDNGYLIANLNTKTEGCYFVWDKGTKQILLVDSTDNYAVIYGENASENKDNWYFAISDPALVATVKAAGYVNAQNTVANIKDLMSAIAAGGTVYVDESTVVDDKNTIEITGDKNIVLELGNSSLNTSGVLKDVFPIYVVDGNLTINGGVIGAEGSGINVDGNRYSCPLVTEGNTYTVLNGTTFNVSGNNGYLLFGGKVDFNNVTVNSNGTGVQVSENGEVTLTNTNVKAAGAALWVCNLCYTDDTQTEFAHIGTGKMTVVSGTYEGGNAKYGVIVSCGGDLVITGGTFISNGSALVSFVDTTGSVSIQGGTFNMDPTAYVADGYVVTNTTDANGVTWYTVTAK